MKTLNRFSILVILWCVLGAADSAYGRTEKYFDLFEASHNSEISDKPEKKGFRSHLFDLPMFRNHSQLSSRNRHLSLIPDTFSGNNSQFQILQKKVNCSLETKYFSMHEDFMKNKQGFSVMKGIVFINKSYQKNSIKNSSTLKGFHLTELFHLSPSQIEFDRSVPINIKSEESGFGENIKWLSFRNYSIFK